MDEKNKMQQSLEDRTYLCLQKILRIIDLGRSMKGKTPSITPGQMRILSLFYETDVVHISEASRKLRMSISSANNLVTRLQKAGYIKRKTNTANSRYTDVTLTAKGRRSILAFRKSQIDDLSHLLSRLEPADAEHFVSSLDRAANILEKTTNKEVEDG